MKKILVIASLVLLTSFTFTPADNSIRVEDVVTEAGGEVTVKVLLNTQERVGGLYFQIIYDRFNFKILSSVCGKDTESFKEIVNDIDAANERGRLTVSMFDSTFKNPVQAGSDRETLLITFSVDSTACGINLLEIRTLGISNEMAEIMYESYNGSIKVPCQKLGDINMDGEVNILDLLALLQILSGN